MRVAVHRVAQGSLAKAAKHARASYVDVSLIATPGAAELRVRDDGVGFDPGAVPTGMGPVGMRERAALVGAPLRIRARSGGGTVVVLRRPAPRTHSAP